MDYEISYDPDDKGEGKIYVDHEGIAYCPLLGDALMCTTLIAGRDSHRYDHWRSDHLFMHKV